MSAPCNSVGLEVLYQVIGWIAFFAWSFSFYLQVVLNYKRKRVLWVTFVYWRMWEKESKAVLLKFLANL